jgi:hypothetical protein
MMFAGCGDFHRRGGVLGGYRNDITGRKNKEIGVVTHASDRCHACSRDIMFVV